MPRAKRTDRAEARRRHRAHLAEAREHEPQTEQDDLAPEAARSAPRGTPAPGQADPPPARPSIRRAFSESFRNPNFREDLALLPWLAVGTKAIWLPSLLSVLSAVALFTFGLNTWTFLVFQYFAYILPVGALFLAGFLSPRASYLAGAVVGIVATAVLAVTVSTGILDEVNEVFADPDQRLSLVAQGLFTSTFGGAFIASAAAWYKRFLRLASPNRAARRPPPRRPGNGGRPAPRRR